MHPSYRLITIHSHFKQNTVSHLPLSSCQSGDSTGKSSYAGHSYTLWKRRMVVCIIMTTHLVRVVIVQGRAPTQVTYTPWGSAGW